MLAVAASMALAELENDERAENVTAISDELFPFTLRRISGGATKQIDDWSALCRFVFDNPVKNERILDRLRTYKIAETDKPIALNSLTSPIVQPYFTIYNMAVSKWAHTSFLRGAIETFPSILVEAMVLIENEIATHMRHAQQTLRREMNK